MSGPVLLMLTILLSTIALLLAWIGYLLGDVRDTLKSLKGRPLSVQVEAPQEKITSFSLSDPALSLPMSEGLHNAVQRYFDTLYPGEYEEGKVVIGHVNAALRDPTFKRFVSDKVYNDVADALNVVPEINYATP